MYFIIIFGFYFSNSDSCNTFYPENIIVYPYSCTNITLNKSGSSKMISVKIISKDRITKELIWHKDFPTYEMNYYYLRYLHDSGDHWISLCDLDHRMVGNYLEFEIIENFEISFYCSGNFRIGDCNYCKDCTNNFFPPNDKYIDDKTDVQSARSRISIELKKESFIKPIFLRFSVCYYLSFCTHVNINASESNSLYSYKNLFIFDHFKMTLNIKCSNTKLSRSTIHILWMESNKVKIVTTTLNFNKDLIKFISSEDYITILQPISIKLISYYPNLIDNQINEFIQIKVSYLKPLREYKLLNFKFTQRNISWITKSGLSYSILIIDFELMENEVLVMETFLLIMDYHPDIVGNYTSPSENIDSGGITKCLTYELASYFYSLLSSVFILLIIVMVIICYRNKWIKYREFFHNIGYGRKKIEFKIT